jgi:hypothetical protein
MAGRYMRGLPGLLRTPLTAEDCRRGIEEGLASREDTFLRVLSEGVFTNPRSPYRKLLEHLGIELGDVRALVGDHGVEGALARLYDAGVRVSLDEWKARRPLVRPGFEVPLRDRDFDNPLNARHFSALSGGSSSGTRRSMPVDLDVLAHVAGYELLLLEGFDLLQRPVAQWYPLPPGIAGIGHVLMGAKLGITTERWFSQSRPRLRRRTARYALFTRMTIAASRFAVAPIPRPEYTPPAEAERVARWLAEKKAQGSPGLLRCTPSSAVRVCRAAVEAGLDISGTFFRTGGEPLTAAKSQLISQVGCRACGNYPMSELGQVGIACAQGTAVDDVHLLPTMAAVLRREREVGAGQSVGALYCTTVHPGSAKLLLNAESGDHAVLELRGCSCPFGELGLTAHLHGIGSYDKLSSEGMNFQGSAVAELVEKVLPQSFGGGPGDYQFIELEQDGLTRVTVAVSPRLDGIDSDRVVETVLAHLGSRGGPEAMMAGIWRSAQTLSVVRREPYMSEASKTPYLHTLKR